MSPIRSDHSSTAGLSELERRVLDQIDEEDVVAFHRGLVRIPSINPPGDVVAAIDYVEDPLRAAGFACERYADLAHMPNLVARIGNGDGPTLAFNAHVDVVPIGDRDAWSHDPFGAEIEDGRIYGRGAGDDKASVTAQVMAGIALARSRVAIDGTLVVNEVADEEVAGVHGTKWLVKQGVFTPDFVVVGEQTLNRVALGEKGASPTRVTVRGRTAHGALPWEGANAIEAVAEIIVALRREYWPILGTRTHEHFHPSSASVNMITGGVKANVVPDVAEIYIDRRIVPGEDVDVVRAEIDEIVQRTVADIPGVSAAVDAPMRGLPASLTNEHSPIVQTMVTANRKLGLSTDVTGFSMATDGRYFAKAGVPTIIYGPGDPKLAHVPDEWVGVDEIIEATRAYALTAAGILCPDARKGNRP